MKTTKIVGLLAALCLVTSCFAGGTLAKYVTTAEGADTARVAKFGVTVTAESDVFKPSYDDGAVSVLADDDADVVAPGTTGTATAFTIEGAPEVDVFVNVTLDMDEALNMVTLAAGEYDDATTAEVGDKFTLAENYYPVVWTLTKDGTDDVATGNLEAIETYLASISKKYEVESNDFANIVGEYELTWAWAFGNAAVFAADANPDLKITDADKYDTELGNQAAVNPAAANLQETFSFNIAVAQVD